MSEDLKLSPMRLLSISEVQNWDKLYVYEHVPQQAIVWSDSYMKTDECLWHKTAVLSWKWAQEKPEQLETDFSPMSKEQFRELKHMLSSCQDAGLDYVWIDWCCAPQYRGKTMTEVLRSKVYYARARQLLVLPTFCQPPEECCEAIREVVKKLDGSPAQFSCVPTVQLLHRALSTLLAHSHPSAAVSIAKHDYFRRMWTLVERMARHGVSECLANRMSLETWLGMVLDALLFVQSSSGDESDAVIFQKTICGHKNWIAVSNMLRTSTVTYENNDDVSKLLAVLLEAVIVWQKPLHVLNWDGAPTKDWLRSYLQNAHYDCYQAGKPEDKVWAVYSYFISNRNAEDSQASLLHALRELVQQATGISPVLLPQQQPAAGNTNDSITATQDVKALLIRAAYDVKAANVVSRDRFHLLHKPQPTFVYSDYAGYNPS